MQDRIGQYEISEKISETRSVLVCRGRQIEDGNAVVLKILNPFATEHDLSRLRHEFAILSIIQFPGVIKAYELVESEQGLVLVLEDIGGESLDQVLSRGKGLVLEQFLELASGLAETLGHLHRLHIIHKDINPAHIVLNTKTGDFRLIGFGISDEVPERSVTPQHPSAIEGTLAYISPEQTGRINRPIDYRTDFYSLGVTFYQMLARKLPCEASDALGMVYCHIAKTAIPLHVLEPNVPEMVSLIVMKLMAKMADDRYQSAWGLKADLGKCLIQLRSKGEIPIFELGEEDFSDQLRVPQKLYGRQKEIKQLLEAFDSVSAGERRLLLVAGYAGVGKTALVREINRSILESDGYFIEGKFDQLQRNVPYYAWIQALTELVNYMLMESEAQLSQWKQKILSSVGNVGRVLTEVIPNLEVVIGSQPEVPSLGASEAQNRFIYLFQEFIRAISTKYHPLVVFLDDLQWIDAASLNLLETLMGGEGISNLLVIGAYRDNEVDALHPLTKAVETLSKEKTAIHLLVLKDLSERTINELIADTVHRPSSQTAAFTHLVYSKTGGNPFFLRQTLRSLSERQAIFLDIESRQWKWNITALRDMEIAENIIALMLGSIRRFPPESQQILSLAACMGFRFDLPRLGIIAGQPEAYVLEKLQPALREGLITPLDRGFQFAHDRILQAAYSLIPDADKKRVHFRIGKLLIEHMPERDHEEQLFTVIDHLNIGAELLRKREEKLELARLNLRAGSKARASAAFSAAAKYFEAGIAMLDKQSWKTDYGLALELYTKAAEAASLLGGFERTDRLFVVITSKARAAIDTVGAYESKMNSYLAQGKLQEALDAALEILEKLGLPLPGHPSDEDIARTMDEVKSLYAGIPIEDLIHLPKMTDGIKLAIAHIISKTNAPAFIGRPNLHLVIVPNEVILALKNGISAESPYFYAAYALFLCGYVRDFDAGYRFGRIALGLLEATESQALKSKTLDQIGGHVWHFRQHLRTTLPYLETGYQSGLKTGDLEYVGYNAFFYCNHLYFAGVDLRKVDQAMDSYGEAMKRVRAEIAYLAVAPYRQAVKNLLHSSDNPCLLSGKCFHAEEMLPLLEQTQNTGVLATFHVNRLVLCYLFEEFEQAFECAEMAERNKGGMLAMFEHAVTIFYDSLASLQIYPGKSSSEQAQILERVSVNQQEMKRLADSAPMNHLHKFYLVEAERMRVAGKDMAALDYYDRTISLARENEYIQEEALANELAAKFWLKKDKGDIARVYMEKARNCYESWGAKRKIQDLEKRYPYLLGTKLREERTETPLELLDLSTLMKTTHTISREIEMKKLLDEVIHIIMENTGAQSGFLLLERDGAWQIVEGIEAEQEKIPLPVNMDESDLVSPSVISFVTRTKEKIVLDDAANQGDFINDPYIKQKRTKSLLCAPLLSRGRLIGILYLENNLTTQAFSPQRVQLLEMLLSQAAISLENAQVYEALRESEELNRFTLSNIVDAVFLTDDAGSFIYISNVEFIFGYSFQEIQVMGNIEYLLGKDLFSPAELESSQRLINIEREIIDKFGKAHTLLINVVRVSIKGGTHLYTCRDVTERKRAEEALRESEAKLEEAQHIAHVGYWEHNFEVGSAALSEEARRIFGLDPEERIFNLDQWKARLQELIHPEDRNLVTRAVADALAGGPPYNIEYRVIRPNGEVRTIHSTGEITRDESGHVRRMFGIMQDITERKQMEQEIVYLANHDALTGFPNRRFFIEVVKLELQQARRNQKKMSILFMDLDRFKEVNDTLGHEKGDELLKQAASRIRNVIRSSDTVSRIGGDEFNIILTNFNRTEDIADIVRKIIGAFRERFIIAGHELHVTASIGVSVYPEDGEDIDHLLRYADIAMYYAKESGRDTYKFYNPNINLMSIERMRLQTMMRRSLELGEMIVYYQPQIDLNTRKMISAESLVRWHHPERGLLYPEEFLPLAEETGFITEIDEWVLRNTCSQLRSLMSAGLFPFCLAVNLSGRQFRNPELVDKISRILKEYNVPPDSLEIEITEGTVMIDIEHTSERLKELKQMGVRIAIDDFGTGYSSLNYLKRLPLQKLKIDKSFVQDIARDPEDRAIISAVTALAHTMNMKVLAEGVETQEQLSLLSVADCDQAQGFFFSHPLPPDDFQVLMSTAAKS
jgi:diguanylate cyclase (GGDEF)-like protein/PAS domain S-box-containing protein